MTHVAPQESADHKHLRSLASQMGVKEDVVRELLWKLNAPDSLTAIIQIADNIRSSIRLAESQLGHGLEDQDMCDWLLILDFIVDNKSDLSRQLGPHINEQARLTKRGPKSPLYKKAITRHPIYSALWNFHDNNNYCDEYRILQFHIMRGHLELMMEVSTIETYEAYSETESILGSFNSSTIEASKLLRDLSSSTHLSKFTSLLSRKLRIGQDGESILMLPHELFYLYLVQQRRDFPIGILTKWEAKFGLFFEKAYIDPSTEIRRGGGKRKRVRLGVHDGHVNLSDPFAKLEAIMGDPDDPDSDWGIQYLIREQLNQREWLEMGLDPGENETGEELQLSEYGISTKSLHARTLSAHGQANQLVMANQLLRGRWSQMTVWEVSLLMSTCGKKFREIINSAEIDDDQVLILEAIALIMVMLWTGSPLARAKKITVTNYEQAGASKFTYLLDLREWRIEPFLPEYHSEPSIEQVSLSRSRADFVHLPDVFNVGNYLALIARKKDKTEKYKAFFNRTVGTYKKAIKSLIKELPEGHRVSETKISRYLFHLISSEISGDVVDAIITTGTFHPLGKSILHYSTPSVDSIRTIYQDAIGSVVEDIYKEMGKKLPDHNNPESMPGEYLGSRLCPTMESVELLVSNLQARVSKGLIGFAAESYAEYHNAYTIYTSQMLGYATGFRAIKDPFVSLDEIDFETGLAIISDKDGPDFYNSRVAWIPDIVLEQILLYESHRQAIVERISLRAGETPSHFMFLLNPDFSTKQLRPKETAPYLKQIFPMALNVNRRFLRTELKERGCPVEIINGFMGHWSRGEEPWGKYSSLSYSSYIAVLQEFIPNLLGDLSWKPMKSRIAV